MNPATDLDLTGRHALVCGASRGIGAAAAHSLAGLGATVIVLARNEDALAQVLEHLPTPARQTHGRIVADVNDSAALAAAAGSLAQQPSGLQILVNNSGGPPAGTAHEAGTDAYVAAFRQHVVASQTLVRTLLPSMQTAGYGRIVNVISTSVKEPIPGLGVSNTIRGAMASWSKTLATELAPFGITVNNVLPGYTRTERLAYIFELRAKASGTSVAEAEAAARAEVPAGRFAEPREVGNAVAFLASPAAGYINGVSLAVDGGRTRALSDLLRREPIIVDTIGNFIGGQTCAPSGGVYLDCHDPATGKVYARVPDSAGADVNDAVEAAKAAFPGWSTTPAAERAAALNRLAAMIRGRFDTLAMAECVDTGKPLKLARQVDIPRAVTNLEFFAAAATQFASESHAMEDGAINYTLRQPLGVVACISPWNLPLYLFTWKLAPALAAGNCVVAKPSEVTPMTAFLFSGLCDEAGLPPGVLNVLHGSGPSVGQVLVEHPDIAAVSFTGGTATGRRIAATTASALKKLSLELGGKNPTLVFADCDWDKTMATTVRSAFTNQGQVCLCGSRILVQRDVYDRFRAEFVRRVASLTVGDPLARETDQGAVVSRVHMDKILGAVDRARAEGGTVLCGGERASVGGRCENGWFVSPTVIEGLDAGCRTNQDEIFGPVVTLTPFDDDDQALALANGTGYGLAASIHSRDVSRCHRLAAHLDSGLVWINCWMVRDLRTPMGGMKQSGLGREGGFEAMRFFTEPRNVCVQY